MAAYVGTIRKVELVAMCKAKGWRGDESRHPTDFFSKYLKDLGVQQTEINEFVLALRSGRVGSAAPQQQVNAGDVQAAVSAAIAKATAALDFQKMVAEAVAKAQPARIVIDGATGTQVKIDERTHPLFEKILRLVRAGLNVLLVGPAGCGKTTAAHQVAKALKRKYGTLHCTAGASESQLTGWLLPIGKDGAFKYVPSEFVKLYEDGESVFLLDEIDAADPNVLLVINSALANGAMHVPQRYDAPHIPRGKNAAIIAAANTYGTGADMTYGGRNSLDGATLDRFYVIEMSYDAALEAQIAGVQVPSAAAWQATAAPTAEEIQHLHAWVQRLREKVRIHKLPRIISTRMLQKAVAARKAGVPTHEIKRDLLAGWSRDDLIKIGEAN